MDTLRVARRLAQIALLWRRRQHGCCLLLLAATLSPAAVGALAAASSIDAADGRCARLATDFALLPAGARELATEESLALWRQRVVARVLVERRLVAAAEALGLDEDPELLLRLTRARERLLLESLEASFEVDSLSAEEVAARFSANRERYRRPESISSRFILLALAVDAPEAEVAIAAGRLQTIRREHAAGTPFGTLVKLHSEAENAARGGVVATSARGRLLEVYEEAAWQLAPGEVSAPVRLPDGLALILLDKLFPARTATLEMAAPGIEKRLRYEKSQARREVALSAAARRWPSEVTWPDGPAGEPRIRFVGETLTLADLGLEHRPARLAQRVEDVLRARQLQRLAIENAGTSAAATDDRLLLLRHRLLVAAALAGRVAKLLPIVSESELQRVYTSRGQAFREPERRQFEVALVPAEKGSLRQALARAEQLAAAWRRGQEPDRADGARRERWGPLPRSGLGGSTSPRLAAVGFALAIGEVAAPTRLERYSRASGRYMTEGYAVLRLVRVEAAVMPPFEAVLSELRAMASKRARRALESRVRVELATQPEVALEQQALASCPLIPPSGD